MALVHANGRPITQAEVRRARMSAVAVGRNEGAASRGTFMQNWRPGLRSADADWLGDRDQVVARSRDIARNDAVATSAVARRINSAVGFRWDLSSQPNALALGISEDAAAALGDQIESAWEQYAYGYNFQADAERTLTFGQLLRASAAHIMQDGEMVGLIEWAADEATPFKTRLRLVDPDRLSNPSGLPDSAALRGGIARNAAGVPVGGWIREGHPNDLGATPNMTWKFWPRYSTNLGRPQLLHAFDKLRAGQSRGVTRFAAVLKSFRALSKFTDATLEAATVNALFVAFVKSNAGPDAVSESFDDDALSEFASERIEYYKDNPVTLDGVQIPVLGLDDSVEMQTAARETGGFDAFTRSILRLISAALGLTYEELSMDFSQTNYSSARAALLIAWNETLALRGLIETQIAWPFLVAWLEEAFDNGTLTIPDGAPDFYDAIDAYAEGSWRGPARGYIDPTKEIDAAQARVAAGVSSVVAEAADQGRDWRVIAQEEKRARAYYASIDVPYPGDAEILARVGQTARDPAHNAALDAAPAPAAA